MGKKAIPLEERLDAIIESAVRQPNGCLIPRLKPTNSNGQIVLNLPGKKKVLLNRAIYEYKVEDVADDEFVRHTCGTVACIETSHLYRAADRFTLGQKQTDAFESLTAPIPTALDI